MDSPKIKSECKCDTLLEYVKYEYENTISGFDNFSFINNNQTTLANDNKSAIQLEYELSLAGNEQKAFTVFTEDNNSFYDFTIYADNKESYPKYVADFKKMIDSLKFVSTNMNQRNTNNHLL